MCEPPLFLNALQGQTSSTVDFDDPIRLRPVDSVDVTIVVDNTIDYLLASGDGVNRRGISPGWTKRPQLIAEHGFSALFTFRSNGEERSLLYDAGLTPEVVTHNLDLLEVRIEELDAIVLSHGHVDHHGGLLGIIKKTGRKGMPLFLHPDAWRNRKFILPAGEEWELPSPSRKELEKADVRIVEAPGPSLLLGDEVLVSGQVERVTDFEKGLPLHYAEKNGAWSPDPWVWDDQGIICDVKGKGLVIVSSCSHSGVVNVFRNAQRITGTGKVHAFIGGLHLPGRFEEIIPQTVRELETIRPDVIVPAHCTGWKATHEIARRLPEAFVQSSVGSKIHFG